MVQIIFKSLKLHNFKSHRDLSVEFGDLTEITGDNAKGKSSILESISWLLYGTDTLGSKLDPTPIGYEFDEVKVELLFTVDDKDILLGRGLVKGKAKYWINEVPSKATEFNELVESLFDKDLFLSLFNPSYFFTMHWQKQREMILRYVTVPANKEVFKQLPKPQADKLGELVKKYSLEDLEKIHRENKNETDKQYIAAQSRTKTLQEQLDSMGENEAGDYAKVQAESNKLLDEIKEIEKAIASADENNRKINDLRAQINSLLEQRERMKNEFPALRDEPIEDTCRVCRQPLKGEAIKAAEKDKQERIRQFKTQFDEIVIKRKELESELATLEYIDVSEQIEKIRKLEKRRSELEESISRFKQSQQLEKQIEQAKKEEAETLESRNESIFILDAIKAFRAKEAELQAEKVQALFTTLSIRLFEQQKNGEIKPTFEIEYDGRPHSKLSLSEGIRAGLELRDVLSQQSGVIAPCFIDNAESITTYKQPNGQLIVSKVVAGQELKIEKEDEK